MTSIAQALIDSKNDWLKQQVEVQYPTPESLQGRELYFSRQRQVKELNRDSCLCEEELVDEVYLVDFHRLTIMFAQLQASAGWHLMSEQALIVEFLSQIILSPSFLLVVGFKQHTPIAAAMVSRDESSTTLLVSDIALLTEYQSQQDMWLSDIVKFLSISDNALDSTKQQIIVEL